VLDHDPVLELERTVRSIASTIALDAHGADELAGAMVAFMIRHVELLEHLADGLDPLELVGDVIGHWPEDALVSDNLPRHGVELLPVAHAVLDAAGDRRAVLDAAERTAAHLGAQPVDHLQLVELVALEAADALVLWEMSLS
jgi:hypothetical protein